LAQAGAVAEEPSTGGSIRHDSANRVLKLKRNEGVGGPTETG